MKFTVNADEFADAVDTCRGAIATRTTKPVLMNIKLTADDNFLYLSGTDLEVGVRCKIPATVEESGSTTISADKLVKILRSTDSENISIASNESVAKVKTESTKYDLPVISSDEFPDFEVSKETTCNISSDMLHDMIKKVIFAVETRDNTRFAVTGVNIEVSPNSIRLVGTDTKRLAITENSITGIDATALLPIKTVKLLLKMEGEIRVFLGKNDAIFECEDCVVYSRLLEGKFPPYRQFMPKSTNKEVVLESTFGDAVKQAAICADDTNRCDFEFDGNTCNISSKGVESGKSDVSVKVGYEGDKFNIAFDHEYVSDVFKVTDGPLSVKFTKENDRAIFSTTNFQCLVVPMVA